ncbi:hypothetical protein QCA50_015554 [Cerrena zonata]|uniref:F-box domain-containing protein n=1 Tax=Cerrena zonata TaxID=2478898 RepID=A0AAW0FVZ3_9APHY
MQTLVQRLPQDALTRIFALVEPTFRDFGLTTYDFDYNKHFAWAYTLSLVCRRWRATLIQSPQFWTTIIWRPFRKPYVRAALERSGTLPIMIYALAGMGQEGTYEWDEDSDSDDDSEDEEESSSNEDIISVKCPYLNYNYLPEDSSVRSDYYDPDDFVEDVVKHLHRIRAFHLTIPGFRGKVLAQHLLEKPAPILETLTLGTSVPHLCARRYRIIPRLFNGQTPSLRHLTLKHQRGWPILFARDLTHLSLIYVDLNDMDIYTTFLDTLYIATKLEVLTVTIAGGIMSEFWRTSPDRAPVPLGKLRTLAIDMSTPASASRFLSHLTLPSTTCILVASNCRYDDNLDGLILSDQMHLSGLADYLEIVLFWEMGDSVSLLIKSCSTMLPLLAGIVVRTDDLSTYLRNVGLVFDLGNVRRLSSYHRFWDTQRDHEPDDWQKVLDLFPNLEALHLFNYIPWTMLSTLSSADEVIALEGTRGELDTSREMVTSVGADGEAAQRKYEEARSEVRKNTRSYLTLLPLYPSFNHEHKIGQTTPYDLKLNGNPAEARITYGCQWEHETRGDHEIFIETSVILKTALDDEAMSMTAREEIRIAKLWWKNWRECLEICLFRPSLLFYSYEDTWDAW